MKAGNQPVLVVPFLAHPESMTACLVHVELHGPAGCLPGIEQTKPLLRKQWIVGGDHGEHRRRVRRHFHRLHRTVDRGDEGRLCLWRCQRGDHGDHRTGRKTDHSYASGIHAPLLRARPDEREGGFGVGNLFGPFSRQIIWPQATIRVAGVGEHGCHGRLEFTHRPRGSGEGGT